MSEQARPGAAPDPSPPGAPDPSFWSGRPVVVTGGAGFLGSEVVARLRPLGADLRVVRSAEHDLREPAAARDALAGADVVLHLAANVGGIGFNLANPGPLARDNLAMGLSVFEAAREHRVGRLVVAGTVCSYPLAPPSIPFREQEIWSGPPEGSNAPYGNAKRMLLVLSAAYRRQYGLDSCVPVLANLYGPGDDFDPESSHVVAAAVRRYVEAAEAGDEEVVMWGSGDPSREFLHVRDGARALLLAAERPPGPEPVNVGTGVETTIRELAGMIAGLAGFEGRTSWDRSRPDGQPRRVLDTGRARELLGFEAEVPLEAGLRETVAAYRAGGAGSG